MGCVHIPVILYFGSEEYSGRGQRECASAFDLAENEEDEGWYASFQLCTLYGTAWCPGRIGDDGTDDGGERDYEQTTTHASNSAQHSTLTYPLPRILGTGQYSKVTLDPAVYGAGQTAWNHDCPLDVSQVGTSFGLC